MAAELRENCSGMPGNGKSKMEFLPSASTRMAGDFLETAAVKIPVMAHGERRAARRLQNEERGHPVIIGSRSCPQG